MARTANVFARVEPTVKEAAEEVLENLGIPMSNAVGMFLRQVVLQQGIPFEMKLPKHKNPLATGALSDEELTAELEKGIKSAKEGKLYSADEVEQDIRQEFGL